MGESEIPPAVPSKYDEAFQAFDGLEWDPFTGPPMSEKTAAEVASLLAALEPGSVAHFNRRCARENARLDDEERRN